jgi:hypothetical protein
MNDWQPVTELERLLDALEAELLSATDEEIRDALGRHQPARLAIRAVADAIAMPEIIGWPSGMASVPAFDQPLTSVLGPREKLRLP